MIGQSQWSVASLVLSLGASLAGCAVGGLLPVGSSVSALSGTDQSGKAVSLAAQRGRYAVVFFYPKDGTPGCTKEACAFRDVWDRYQAANVQVIGVSSDNAGSHEEFAKKHTLPFPLVADTDRAWAKAFGVSGVAGFYSRVTFVITPNGQVGRVYDKVDPGLHANQVLQDITAMTASASAPTP
jgi:thioredoxin-dependent peroxiredoxin